MESIVDVRFGSGTSVIASVGGFEIVSDQPKKIGGDGNFPSPPNLFVASLATCSAIFASRFCAQHGMDPTAVGVRMVCETNEKDNMITKMTVQLTLPEGFPEKYREAVMRSVSMCHVKKQVQAAPEFAVEIAEG